MNILFGPHNGGRASDDQQDAVLRRKPEQDERRDKRNKEHLLRKTKQNNKIHADILVPFLKLIFANLSQPMVEKQTDCTTLRELLAARCPRNACRAQYLLRGTADETRDH